MVTTQTLQDMPFKLVPREAKLLLCSAPASFPPPAQDDMEEPIDLAAWLIDKPHVRMAECGDLPSRCSALRLTPCQPSR